jgi:hypothetical protein
MEHKVWFVWDIDLQVLVKLATYRAKTLHELFMIIISITILKENAGYLIFWAKMVECITLICILW